MFFVCPHLFAFWFLVYIVYTFLFNTIAFTYQKNKVVYMVLFIKKRKKKWYIWCCAVRNDVLYYKKVPYSALFFQVCISLVERERDSV